MSSEALPISNTPPSISSGQLASLSPNPTASSSATLNESDIEKASALNLKEEAELKKQQEEGKEAKSSDTRTLHTWDGPTDPDHPTNWPLWKKLCTTVMLASVASAVALNSAMFEPATQQVMKEFKGLPKEVASLGTSLYVLVLSPELYFLLPSLPSANFRRGFRPRSSLLGSAI